MLNELELTEILNAPLLNATDLARLIPDLKPEALGHWNGGHGETVATWTTDADGPFSLADVCMISLMSSLNPQDQESRNNCSDLSLALAIALGRAMQRSTDLLEAMGSNLPQSVVDASVRASALVLERINLAAIPAKVGAVN